MPEAAMINSFLRPALSMVKKGIMQHTSLKVRSEAPRTLDMSWDSPTVVKSCSE